MAGDFSFKGFYVPAKVIGANTVFPVGGDEYERKVNTDFR